MFLNPAKADASFFPPGVPSEYGNVQCKDLGISVMAWDGRGGTACLPVEAFILKALLDSGCRAGQTVIVKDGRLSCV